MGESLADKQSILKIGLESNGIGADGVKSLSIALEGNKSLREIYLYNNAIGNNGLEYVGDLIRGKDRLSIVGIEANGFVDNEDGFERLEAACSYAPALEKLYLSNNLIGERAAIEIGKILEKSESLREVHLQNNKLGDRGAIELSYGLGYNRGLT